MPLLLATGIFVTQRRKHHFKVPWIALTGTWAMESLPQSPLEF